MGRCEKFLCFMGRKLQGGKRFRILAVKWVVAKLQGDRVFIQQEMRGREVTERQISIPVFLGARINHDPWV